MHSGHTTLSSPFIILIYPMVVIELLKQCQHCVIDDVAMTSEGRGATRQQSEKSLDRRTGGERVTSACQHTAQPATNNTNKQPLSPSETAKILTKNINRYPK